MSQALTTPQSGSPRWWPVALAGVAILAFIVRLSILNSESLWLDDAYSLMIAGGHGQAHRDLPLHRITTLPPLITTAESRPLFAVIAGQAGDVHPPLYFLALRTFYFAAPVSDPELARLPGIGFSVATCVVLCLLARRLLPDAQPFSQLLPGILFAIAPTAVFMSLEVRGYSLATLLTVAVAYFASCLARSTRGVSILAMSVCAVAAMCTHYFSLFPLLGILGWLLVVCSQRKNVVIAALMVAFAFAVLCGPLLQQQLRAAGRWDDWISLHPTQAFSAVGLLMQGVAVPARLFADPISKSTTNVIAGMFLLGIPVVLSVSAAGAGRAVLLPVFALAATIAGLLTLDVCLSTLHLNFIRYAMPAAGFAALLPACIVLPKARYLPLVVGLSLVVYSVLFFNAPVQPRPDLRALAGALNAAAAKLPPTAEIIIARPAGDTLEDDPQTLALMLAPYLPAGRPVRLLDDTAKLPGGRPALVLSAYGILPLPAESRFVYFDPAIPAHIYLLP